MHPDVRDRPNHTIDMAESIWGQFPTETNLSQYPRFELLDTDDMDPMSGEGDIDLMSGEGDMNMTDDLGMDLFHSFLSERDFLPEDLSVNIKVFFILTYSIIMLLSVVGNSLVMWVIAANTKMRTVTNTYLVSLAVSDMLIAVVNMPFQLLFHVENEWTLGQVTCKMSSYVQGVTIIVSILTLSGMAVERYYAIRHPLRARHVHTLRRTAAVLVSFWVVSCLLAAPQLAIQRIEPIFERLEGPPFFRPATICVEYFSDDRFYVAYTLVVYFLFYIIPVMILFVAYGKIAYTLWVRGPIGETPENSRDHEKRMRETKKIVRMLVVIVALFALSWFPFFTCQVYLLFVGHSHSFRVLKAVFQLFGYSNCCVNPIIYCFLNESFRHHFLKTLPCLSGTLDQRLRRENSKMSSTKMSHLAMSTNQSTVV